MYGPMGLSKEKYANVFSVYPTELVYQPLMTGLLDVFGGGSGQSTPPHFLERVRTPPPLCQSFNAYPPLIGNDLFLHKNASLPTLAARHLIVPMAVYEIFPTAGGGSAFGCLWPIIDPK